VEYKKKDNANIVCCECGMAVVTCTYMYAECFKCHVPVPSEATGSGVMNVKRFKCFLCIIYPPIEDLSRVICGSSQNH